MILLDSPGLVAVMCRHIPHSMHPTCKLLNFLRMRVVCRSAVRPISAQIAYRVVLLLHHARQEIRDAALTIKDSGILFQLLFCGGRTKSNLSLVIDPRTGIPKGMTQEYWDERQGKKLFSGWTLEGKLEM